MNTRDSLLIITAAAFRGTRADERLALLDSIAAIAGVLHVADVATEAASAAAAMRAAEAAQSRFDALLSESLSKAS